METPAIQRRIVTDGSVFRVQFSVDSGVTWSFYFDATFQTQQSAQVALEHYEELAAKDAPERWAVAE